MAISKAINLNFSDGNITVYTRQATLYIPFEVDSFTVKNVYTRILNNVTVVQGLVTSDLVPQSSNGILTSVQQLTSVNPTTHIYNIPRPINGTYNFTINLSNILEDFLTTNTRIGYITTGYITNIGDSEMIYNGGDSLFMGTDVVFKQLKTGLGTTLGFDLFNIIDSDGINTITFTPVTTQAYIGTTSWRIESNLLTINDDNALFGTGTYIKGSTTTITSKIEQYKYRINKSLYQTFGDVTFNVPYVFRHYDLTQCNIIMDIEFYEKYKMYKTLPIQNYQNLVWYIYSQETSTKFIDIPFSVDEIEVTNFTMTDISDYNLYGFYSNLVNSSTTDQDLLNHNYSNALVYNSTITGHYQMNKKRFVFKSPQNISGSYNIYLKYALDNTYKTIENTMNIVFQLKFIQYNKSEY